MARILVIDDDAVIHLALTQLLETDGHLVIPASDGNKGLAAFRESPADLVITDILMPEKEGLETIAELRQIDPTVKIIAMSGGGRLQNTDFLDIASQLGAHAVLKKPFQMQELRGAIRSCLPDGSA